MKKIITLFIITIVLIGIAELFFQLKNKVPQVSLASNKLAAATASILEETQYPNENNNSNFWLNSGAFFFFNNNYGFSLQGLLPPQSKWTQLYKQSSPTTTDNGTQPQNILRLITKQKYNNSTEQVYIKITRYNIDNPKNHFDYNGILLFSNYIDSDNLYYAGIRVDGTSVIKKKVKGIYTTLAQEPLPREFVKAQLSQKSKLPLNTWIGLKTIVTKSNNSTTITLYTDLFNTGIWTKTLSVTDIPSSFTLPGSGGVRTDFMDIETKDFIFKNK